MTGADLISAFKRQPIGFGCGAICLVCGLWLYFRSDASAALQEASDQKTLEVAKVDANIRNSERLRDQAAALVTAASELESRLMRADQLAVNQQYFYRLEGETGVKLVDIRQSGVAAAKTGAKVGLYIGVPYNVSAQGTFPQVLAFLRRLETGRHFSRFTTVTFDKVTGADAGAGLITVTIAVELLGLP